MPRTTPFPVAETWDEHSSYPEVGNVGLDEDGATRFVIDRWYKFNATTEEWVDQGTTLPGSF